jgi:MerR family transcriptional regulator, redox-sensitive transcriptional activator SoxR
VQIGEVARRSGVNSTTIRYYESEGLLLAPARNGGRREFDARVIDRLKLIAAAQQFGFRLNEIREMLKVTDGKEPKGGWRSWVQAKVNEIETNMTQMKHARTLLIKSLECACIDLATCGKTCEWVDDALPAKIPVNKITTRKKRTAK